MSRQLIKLSFFIGVFICATGYPSCQAQNNTTTFTPLNDWRFSIKKERKLLLSSAVLFGTAYMVEHFNDESRLPLDKILLLDASTVNRFDRSAIGNFDKTAGKVSDYLQYAATIAPFTLLIPKRTRGEFDRIMLITAETFMVNFGFTHLTKNIFPRPRPYVFNASLGDSRERDRNNTSFYSGHTSHTASLSIMMGNVVQHYFPEMSNGAKTVLWTSAIFAPVATAYCRVKAGRHYPSDVIVGILTGSAIGTIIPWLNFRNDQQQIKAYPSMSGMTMILNF